MGWIISLLLLFGAALSKQPLAEIEMTLIASAIFAVAGSVGAVAAMFKNVEKKEKEDVESK